MPPKKLVPAFALSAFIVNGNNVCSLGSNCILQNHPLKEIILTAPYSGKKNDSYIETQVTRVRIRACARCTLKQVTSTKRWINRCIQKTIIQQTTEFYG